MEEASALTRRGFLAEALGAAGSLGAGAALLAGRPARAGQAAPAPVEMARERTVLEGRLAGRPVFVYNHDTSHAGLYRPFFHPLMGPHGRPITQNGEFPGTLRGHYWHRALFIAAVSLAHQELAGWNPDPISGLGANLGSQCPSYHLEPLAPAARLI